MIYDRPYMREPARRPGLPAWGLLLIINLAVYIAFRFLAFHSPEFFIEGIFKPFALSLEGLKSGKIWQLLTFQFMHAGFSHLAGNSIVILFFGRPVEVRFGKAFFWRLFLTGGLVGAVCQLILAALIPTYFGGPMVGASAGASALFAAFCWFEFHNPVTIVTYFFPITMKAIHWLILYTGIAILGILVPDDHIADAAHFGGILTGIFAIKQFIHRDGWPVLDKVFDGSWLPRFKRTPKKQEPILRVTRDEPENLGSEEFISKQVDPILDKISKEGIGSLTEKERKILERARSKMAKR